MRLYLECSMGASGDMLMAALYELLTDRAAFRDAMTALNLPGVTYDYADTKKCGLAGTHITVRVGGIEETSNDIHDRADSHTHADGTEHEHTHSDGHAKNVRRYGYTEICGQIEGLRVPDAVRRDALGVYTLLGQAEAAVHGVSLEDLHFHEVGSLDAVADIVGCCLLVNMLGITEITASPVHVGYGTIRCEHGLMPVPAPATAELLKDVPIYGGTIKGELCTPTGAALLKYFAARFGDMPLMTVQKIGCGMGAKNFAQANCLRAFLYSDKDRENCTDETVLELSCNLDDMTPEALGYAFELLLKNGALDVWMTPVHMKKNRPGTILTCLCTPKLRKELTRLMLENTSTLGVRVMEFRREVLSRSEFQVTTKYGVIRVKTASGFGVHKSKPEFEDIKRAALLHEVPIAAVYSDIVSKL